LADRAFGSKPGAYGAGLKDLIDERCWETRDAFANRLGQLEAKR